MFEVFNSSLSFETFAGSVGLKLAAAEKAEALALDGERRKTDCSVGHKSTVTLLCKNHKFSQFLEVVIKQSSNIEAKK